jgi:hypothetical protein
MRPRASRRPSLTALSDQAAKALARHQDSLSLDGLETLSDRAAKAFAKREESERFSSLSLYGLKTVSEKAAKALQANSNIFLPDKFAKPK